MVLIRLLMLLLLAWIGWRIYRVLTRRPVDPAAPVEEMVRCSHCAVHLPRREALREGDAWFCCESHRAAHVARH